MLKQYLCSIVALLIFSLPAYAASSKIRKAGLAYYDCITALRKNDEVLSRIIILEGLAEEMSLEMRRNRRSMTDTEAAALIAIYPSIKKCRKPLTKAVRRDKSLSHIYRSSFNRYDEIYVDLIDKRLPLDLANKSLIDHTELALTTIEKLQNIDSSISRQQGWEMMKKGLDMMDPPPQPQPPPAPRYFCRTDAYGNTFCNPR